MPTAPPRACPTCGALVASGEPCRQCHPAWVKRGTGRPLGLSWPALRRKVLDRDSGRCQLCGALATHVDHITPRADGGADTLENLRSLCAYHHGVVTGRHARAARDRTVY